MAHLGLTPQSIHQLGGYKVQGKKKRPREKMIEDAKILEEAGAFSVVLECVPEGLAAEVTGCLSIPTIGIGAGVQCDGQVLVINDLLGISDRFTPKFVKKYANLNLEIKKAVKIISGKSRAATSPILSTVSNKISKGILTLF